MSHEAPALRLSILPRPHAESNIESQEAWAERQAESRGKGQGGGLRSKGMLDFMTRENNKKVRFCK